VHELPSLIRPLANLHVAAEVTKKESMVDASEKKKKKNNNNNNNNITHPPTHPSNGAIPAQLLIFADSIDHQL
jgi:hypothetical protein